MTIIRPEVLPDEYVDGYEGRVYQLNGWRKRADAMPTLLQHFFGKRRLGSELSFVEVLARVSGMSTAAFVQRHTMIPLRRAFTREKVRHEHGSSEQKNLLSYVAMRRLCPLAYLCRQCVREDLSFRGFAYWRREHQQPGVFACSVHRTALHFAVHDDAFLHSPAGVAGQAEMVDPVWLGNLNNNEAIQRFLVICSELINRKDSTSERAIARVVCRQARHRGLYLGHGIIDRPLLSDLVKHSFDPKWLDAVVPGLTQIPVQTPWLSIDSAARGRPNGVSSLAYAVILAVLFDCPDAALRAVAQQQSRQGAGLVTRQTKSFSENDLLQAWIADKGCYRAIARKLGCSDGTLRDRALRQGLPNLNRMHAEDIEELRLVLSTGIDGGGLDAFAARPMSRKTLNALSVILTPFLQHLQSAIGPKYKGKRGPKVRPLPPPRDQRTGDATLADV
jgi:hypothetical protein